MKFPVCQIFRVYYDRLIDDADRRWLYQFVRTTCRTALHEDFDRLFSHLRPEGPGGAPGGEVGEDELRSLMFCDFADAKSDAKNYVEVRDLELLCRVVENYLEEFNNLSKKPMNLVLFRSLTLCL